MGTANPDSKPIWDRSGLNVGKLLVFNWVPNGQNPDFYYRNFQFMQLQFLVLLED